LDLGAGRFWDSKWWNLDIHLIGVLDCIYHDVSFTSDVMFGAHGKDVA
jgi:hypothetical protein